MSAATWRPVDLLAVALPLSIVGAMAVLVARAPVRVPAHWPHTVLLACAPLGIAWAADHPVLVSTLPTPVRRAAR